MGDSKTQTDLDEIAKMSTQVNSTSSQVVSKPCWCRSAKILDMHLFRKAEYVDQDQGTENPLLRVLTPSLLKNSTFTDRAPRGLFSIPNSPSDLSNDIIKIYNMWFQIWNTSYLPLHVFFYKKVLYKKARLKKYSK